jgi:hypothetical protein
MDLHTDIGFQEFCLLHAFGPGFLRVDLRSDTPFISCGISFHIKSMCMLCANGIGQFLPLTRYSLLPKTLLCSEATWECAVGITVITDYRVLIT